MHVRNAGIESTVWAAARSARKLCYVMHGERKNIMSLNIYLREEDIPEGIDLIKRNDDFFSFTLLNDSEFEKTVLREIDQAKYATESTFIGRSEWMGKLRKDNLSTGCKTLLNIEKNPDYCFSSVECGYNALPLLRLLKHGNVLLAGRCILYDGDDSECDIVYKGVHYNDFYKFLHYFMDIEHYIEDKEDGEVD